jgi:glycosyltransferase involved in cell wall biosynthesis
MCATGVRKKTEHWLVVAHEASNSGAPRMLLELLRGVRAARDPTWSCEILLGRGGPLTEEFGSLGPVRRLTGPRAEGTGLVSKLFDRLVDKPILQPRRLGRMMEEWRREEIRLVYANSATNGRLLPALRTLGCPVVTHVHELDYSLRRFNSRADLAATLKCTDHFFAVSRAVVSDLMALGVPRERVTRVPNFLTELPPSIDLAAARNEVCQRLHLPPGTRLITACGHIDWLKGPDLFVEMAGVLSRQIAPPVAFLWLGGESNPALARRVRAEARRKNLGHLMHFGGAVRDPERYFAASEIVTVTSRVESFSRVALEAGALGRPVLCFAAARGPADLLDAESMVPELKGSAMAAAVADLLNHPEELERRGRRLRERIAAEFMAGKWIGEILATVETLLHA